MHRDGLQSVSKIARHRDSLFKKVDKLTRLGNLRDFALDKLCFEHLGGQRRACQMLAQAVVQIVSQTAPLAFAGFEQKALETRSRGAFYRQCRRCVLPAEFDVRVEFSEAPQEDHEE